MDWSVLETYAEGMGDEGNSLISELIDIYLENTPKLLTSLRQSITDNDIEVFNRAAHTLKSSSASLGAIEIPLATLKNKMESAVLEFDTVKSVLLSKRPVS